MILVTVFTSRIQAGHKAAGHSAAARLSKIMCRKNYKLWNKGLLFGPATKILWMTNAFAIISLIFVTTLLNNCGTTKRAAIDEKSSFQRSPLVAYGEEIFKRESCENCHTLKIENESLQLISLDGVGGKYSSSWLYYYLFEPQSLIPGSTKSSYKKLYARPLSEKNVSTSDKNKPWEYLFNEADIVEKDLKSQGITTEKTEILALISYIQQIPASKKKIERDSIAYQKYLNKQKIWDKISLDSTSFIIDIAEDDTNKERGKFIFQSNCSPCHGMEGQGGIGPNLTDEYWLHGGDKLDIARTIIFGIPEKGMISWKSQLTPREVGELISFISSIRGTEPKNAKLPQGKKG